MRDRNKENWNVSLIKCNTIRLYVFSWADLNCCPKDWSIDLFFIITRGIWLSSSSLTAASFNFILSLCICSSSTLIISSSLSYRRVQHFASSPLFFQEYLAQRELHLAYLQFCQAILMAWWVIVALNKPSGYVIVVECQHFIKVWKFIQGPHLTSKLFLDLFVPFLIF